MHRAEANPCAAPTTHTAGTQAPCTYTAALPPAAPRTHCATEAGCAARAFGAAAAVPCPAAARRSAPWHAGMRHGTPAHACQAPEWLQTEGDRPTGYCSSQDSGLVAIMARELLIDDIYSLLGLCDVKQPGLHIVCMSVASVQDSTPSLCAVSAVLRHSRRLYWPAGPGAIPDDWMRSPLCVKYPEVPSELHSPTVSGGTIVTPSTLASASAASCTKRLHKFRDSDCKAAGANADALFFT